MAKKISLNEGFKAAADKKAAVEQAATKKPVVGKAPKRTYKVIMGALSLSDGKVVAAGDVFDAKQVPPSNIEELEAKGIIKLI